jgi:2-dehydropantoate 2-reductase
MTRIAVYGAGGVGGYFGARLAQAGAEVHFLARGAHLQALREHGLRVRSVKGDFQVQVQATDDPADIGPCDFVLFCVKTFDTDAAAARLGPLLGDGTAVVSLQNGVENEEKLARAVGEDHVMGGAAFIFAGIAEPGVIVHSGGPASITFGELDGRATQRARRLLAWCERAGFQAELSANVKAVLWAKLAFICAQAGMTAAVRLPIGEIRTVDAAWAAFKRLVAEVCAVAEADGSPVPGAAQDSALALAQAIEPGSFSSLHDDLVAGRRMELEALHGFVVRRAAQHAVAVPTLEAVYAILQPWAIRNQQAAERADPRALPHIRARAEAASDVGEGLRRRDPAVCLDEFARTQPRGQGPAT